MFQEHGSFETMELQVKKKLSKSKELAKEGGHYTKHYLETKEGWSKWGPQIPSCISYLHMYHFEIYFSNTGNTRNTLRSMIQKAWQWAQKTGNVRTNDVHGEEEIRIVLHDSFKHKEVHEEEHTRQGTVDVEAGVENPHVIYLIANSFSLREQHAKRQIYSTD